MTLNTIASHPDEDRVREDRAAHVGPKWFRSDAPLEGKRGALPTRPSKDTRSMTPLVKSVPTNLEPRAYALDTTASLKEALLKSASLRIAPDMSKPSAFLDDMSHWRKSNSLSLAPFACPIACAGVPGRGGR